MPRHQHWGDTGGENRMPYLVRKNSNLKFEVFKTVIKKTAGFLDVTVIRYMFTDISQNLAASISMVDDGEGSRILRYSSTRLPDHRVSHPVRQQCLKTVLSTFLLYCHNGSRQKVILHTNFLRDKMSSTIVKVKVFSHLPKRMASHPIKP